VARGASTTVPGAPEEWERALFDLIRNATAVSPPGAQVHVSLHAEVDGMRIGIRDAGCGIALEDFDDVYAGPALDEVRHALEACGGQISISSGGERPGTRIEVRIRYPESEDL